MTHNLLRLSLWTPRHRVHSTQSFTQVKFSFFCLKFATARLLATWIHTLARSLRECTQNTNPNEVTEVLRCSHHVHVPNELSTFSIKLLFFCFTRKHTHTQSHTKFGIPHKFCISRPIEFHHLVKFCVQRRSSHPLDILTSNSWGIENFPMSEVDPSKAPNGAAEASCEIRLHSSPGIKNKFWEKKTCVTEFVSQIRSSRKRLRCIILAFSYLSAWVQLPIRV